MLDWMSHSLAAKNRLREIKCEKFCFGKDAYEKSRMIEQYAGIAYATSSKMDEALEIT